jgi:superoxide reductase
MNTLSETIRSADWKTEKHVPLIESPEQVAADEWFAVKVTLGKAVAHPNTTEHHIRWIQLYFLPEGAQAPIQVGNFEFAAHGESPEGPNEGSVYTHHEAATSMRVGLSGTLYALAYCNIHGVWQSSKPVAVA